MWHSSVYWTIIGFSMVLNFKWLLCTIIILLLRLDQDKRNKTFVIIRLPMVYECVLITV